jgi:phthalate 4,5-dioxygenase oxygenase subunit
MLTREQNEILCRVGPGTPMGEYMRQFWVPALRAQRLEADGAPVRVRLLGENFIAFRATDGRVGFFDEGCPHRCTSLALARNEDNALTCIFHGWKIDVSGKVVDVPSEPPERRAEFAAKVRVGHYPVREAATLIWVYLGKRADPPPLPNFNWINLPADHICTRIGIVNSNWLNVLEGQLDSAHVGVLHRDSLTIRRAQTMRRQRSFRGDVLFDTGPRFEFEQQPYGYREAAVRKMPDGSNYVRVREYVMPFYSYIPTGGIEDDHTLAFGIPLDDEHSAQWDVRYNLTNPVRITDGIDDYGYSRDNNDYAYNIGGPENGWNQNRRAMKEGSWSGFPSTRYEDFAAAVAQGIICDRTREYLGSSDSSVIRARRMLLEAATRFAKGGPAFGLDNVDLASVYPLDEVIPADKNWRDLARPNEKSIAARA